MTTKEKAFLLAEQAHHGQQYGLYPYSYHLKQVAEVAEEIGFDDEIVIACLLHDILEDTHLSYNDIKKEFGEDIAELVYAVTDELGRNRKERKERTYPKIKGNPKAIAVKLCDRIANVREAKISFNKSFGSSDSKMYKLYKQEHLEFYDTLYDSGDDFNGYAWITLIRIITND